jgi:hypothetical protein
MSHMTGVRDGRGLPDNTVGLALLGGPNFCLSAHHAELQVVMTIASLARNTASVSLSDIVARLSSVEPQGPCPRRVASWGS